MRKILSVIVIALLVTSLIPLNAQANTSSSIIRVALMIDSGGALNTSKPTATLSSANGLQILTADGTSTYHTSNTSLPIRFSLDQYRILVEDTSDMGVVQSLTQRLAQHGYTSYILMYHRQNVARYQVITGDEPSYESATARRMQINNLIGTSKEVLGPLVLQAGSYATLEEATTQVQILIDAGYDASVGYTFDANGANNYLAVVGNEGTEAELTSLWQEIALTFPNMTIAPIQEPHYILHKSAMNVDAGGPQILSHFYTPITGVKVRPVTGGTVLTTTVAEKDNRKYRGEFELLRYQGKMVLVNQLPLEEYLFAVVGTEMASGWPLEALKSQAVIARTYALGKGNRFGIAHISDTTYDQAYYGVAREADDVRQAVLETAGIVLKYDGKLIEAYYYSNAGGITAVGSEVWGTDVAYLRSVSSPDYVASATSLSWYHVVRENGQYGYIRSDLVAPTWQKNTVGFDIVTVQSDNTNLRPDASTSNPSVDKLMMGERLTVIDIVPESNSYQWVVGPIDGVAMMNLINTRATAVGNIPHTLPIQSLSVDSRGPSGRVTSMSANGLPIITTSPDGYRTVFGGLRSTLFDVEESGKFTILGAGGQTVTSTDTAEGITVISAGNVTTKASTTMNELLLYGNTGDVRLVTTYPSFRFHGKGYGHGFGLSQWGARGLAEQGYDYQQILNHYYSEFVTLQPIE